MKLEERIKNILFLWPCMFLLVIAAPISLHTASKYDDTVLSLGIAAGFFIAASCMGSILIDKEKSKGNPVTQLKWKKERGFMLYLVEVILTTLLLALCGWLYYADMLNASKMWISYPLLFCAVSVTTLISYCVNTKVKADPEV